MAKKQTFTAQNDIVNVDVSLFSADMQIVSCLEPFHITATGGVYSFEEHDGFITLKRKYTPLATLTRAKITVYTPESSIIDASLRLKNSTLNVENGIYGNFSINSERCKTQLNGAAFSNLGILGKYSQFECADVTVKQTLHSRTEFSNLISRQGFITNLNHTSLHMGNVGVWGTNFSYCSVAVDYGNVQVALLDTEAEYKLTVMQQNGVSYGNQNQTAERVITVSCKHGNVNIDYLKQTEEHDDGNDSLAENISE